MGFRAKKKKKKKEKKSEQTERLLRILRKSQLARWLTSFLLLFNNAVRFSFNVSIKAAENAITVNVTYKIV